MNLALQINLLCLTVMMAFGTIAKADTIKILSDTWCPYVCDNKVAPGYMSEVATRIFERSGHKVEVSIVNWARAIHDARRNKATAIVGAAYNDAPDFIFPDKTFGANTNYFFTRKDSNWVYKGPSSLAGKRIGVINAYAYGGKIDALIKARPKTFISISGEHPLDQILKMIESKRLDAFIENHIVLRSTMAKLNIPSDEYKPVSVNVADDPKLFIAFSPTNPKSLDYAKIFSKGIVEMRQSGELQKILEKYGLVDWDPNHMSFLGRLNNLSTSRFQSSFNALDMINARSF